MADRTLTARLRVAYDASGLSKFSKGLRGVSQEGKKTSQDVSRNWSDLGKKTSDLGSKMTSHVTVPLLGLGAVAAKMSMDFSATFDQMVALAGVASGEVEGLKAEVLSLSEATGRGPAELADALMQIRGAGLTGQAALDALSVSAHAAAAGLGTTVDIANAVTNVMNAYGAANISAAEAGDVLVASVTAAKVEASEMAPQFGRLLPVASELGIEFHDVAGALAFLTVSSGDASQASTGLSGVLRKMLQPSQQGAAALEQIGLNASKLRDLLGQKGLDGTVIELRKRLGDSGFKQLFDDAEALSAALQMTGASADQFQDIMSDVEGSTGALDQAFKATDNDSRKAQIAWAKAQGAMIKLGDAIVPVVTILADLAGAAVGLLGHMPDELRTAIVLFGALLAAVGPVLQVTGKVAQGFASYSKWLETSSLGTGRFGDQLGKLPAVARGAALALGAIGVAMTAIEVIAGQRESKARGWIEETIGDPGTLDEVRSAIRQAKRELDDLDDQEGKHRLFSVGGANVFATGGDADRQEKIDQLRESIGELEAQEEQLVGQESETAAAYVGTDGALAGLNEETTNAVQALKDYTDALAAQFDPLFGYTDALVGNQEAQARVIEATAALNEARAGGDASEIAAAERDLDAAYRGATSSAMDLDVAANQLAAGIEAGTVNIGEAKMQLANWVAQGMISQATADVMAVKFDQAARKANSVAGNRNASFSTSGLTDAQVKVQNFKNQIDALPWNRNVTITARTIFGPGFDLVQRLGGFAGHAAGGPMKPGEIAWVGEKGPELYQAGPQGGHVYNQQQLGALSSPMSSAGAFGGGVTNVYNVDLRGVITPDARKFRQAVVDAFNVAHRKSRGLNAA